METRIPNWNTLSTLVDRLSIENVKLAHFENALEHDDPPADQAAELRKKVRTQNEIIAALKTELTAFMEETFLQGKYAYMKEERTFT